MASISRSTILQRLGERVTRREPILLAGAGVGAVAKAVVAADIDVLMTYNVARFRMDGHSSLLGFLPYGDANRITLDLAAQILPVSGPTPVVAGVGAADPYRKLDAVLDAVLGVGYSGVTNTPTAGVYDGSFRASLEAQGIGFAREVEMFRLCAERDIFSVAYAFTPEECRAVTDAGADVVAAHLGTTATPHDPEAAISDAIRRSEAMAEAARATRSDVFVVAHGGPLETPAAVARILHETSLVGYIAGSSMERIPVNFAIQDAGRRFRTIELRMGLEP